MENQDVDGEEHMDVSDDEEKLQDDGKKIKDEDSKMGVKGKTWNNKSREIGGFTVIGNVRPTKIKKVKRVLPDWLTNPKFISADLTTDRLPVTDMPGLDKSIVDILVENNITHFFPVQRQVIPSLLDSSATGFLTGRAGYHPCDLCVSAPTGSGKTLAFVLPIVQTLKSRVTCEVRALAVLPVRDLATQVFNVFQTYCKGTTLKVGLLIGQKTFLAEQQSLVKKRLSGYHSAFDILVATPGRLVDHINRTEGFNLAHLRFLVIDEADRTMDEIKQDWLTQVESAIYKARPQPGPLTAANCLKMQMPLQRLLYSATLSQNPEKLQQLNLFQPKLFTCVSEKRTKDKLEGTKTKRWPLNEEEDEEFVSKYTTPASLSEYFIEATPGEKPLIMLHLLHNLKYRNILCFTNSMETTYRLYKLIKLFGGIQVRGISSRIHTTRRNNILKKFSAGKIDIVVCSDAMSRGMDIANVKYVVSYDPPPFIQTYIHRIGRTGRAGKDGTAFTLLQKKEFFHFKKLVKAGERKVRSMKVFKSDLKSLLPKYQETLKELRETPTFQKY